MKCAVCDVCEPCPINPRRCVFGGPFTGYTDGYGVPIILPVPDGPLPAYQTQSTESEP